MRSSSSNAAGVAEEEGGVALCGTRSLRGADHIVKVAIRDAVELLERGLVEMNERDRPIDLVAWIGVRQPVVEAREQDREIVLAKHLAIEVMASQLAAGQDHPSTALA